MSGREFRICEYNLENLFISMEYHAGEDLERATEEQWRGFALAQLRRRQKPLAKVWGAARAILDIDADVYLLTEVGGRDSLENFNRHFLGDRYEPCFVEGNSRRSIDLGFLVRKGLGLDFETRSNKDAPVEVHTYQGKYVARFSRDVAELRLRDGAGLRLILLLVHLKSKLSTDQDFRGKDGRTAEAIALAGLYNDLRAACPEAPIVVGGDFNAELASLELELLNHTDLADFHELLGTPPAERISLIHFDLADQAHPQTLDYLLVSPHLRQAIVRERSFTYRYRGFYGVPEPLPRSFRERAQLPSDHYPVVLTINWPLS
jgi:endonuclease/exonuclease/phosphatase family metal-dependent hydrolase